MQTAIELQSAGQWAWGPLEDAGPSYHSNEVCVRVAATLLESPPCYLDCIGKHSNLFCNGTYWWVNEYMLLSKELSSKWHSREGAPWAEQKRHVQVHNVKAAMKMLECWFSSLLFFKWLFLFLTSNVFFFSMLPKWLHLPMHMWGWVFLVIWKLFYIWNLWWDHWWHVQLHQQCSIWWAVLPAKNRWQKM